MIFFSPRNNSSNFGDNGQYVYIKTGKSPIPMSDILNLIRNYFGLLVDTWYLFQYGIFFYLQVRAGDTCNICSDNQHICFNNKNN